MSDSRAPIAVALRRSDRAAIESYLADEGDGVKVWKVCRCRDIRRIEILQE